VLDELPAAKKNNVSDSKVQESKNSKMAGSNSKFELPFAVCYSSSDFRDVSDHSHEDSVEDDDFYDDSRFDLEFKTSYL
jgi:hypothetical protein